MSTPISSDHPLRKYFVGLVQKTLQPRIGLEDTRVHRYLADLLMNFVRVEALYGLHDLDGRRIEEVADMLVEGELLLGATSFSREREVHRHIGDFTLFWSGVFPEAMPKLRSSAKKDHLINYPEQGKESYYIVSTFNLGRWKDEAPLFRQLSVQFDLLRYGLNLVREEWERLASGGRGMAI